MTTLSKVGLCSILGAATGGIISVIIGADWLLAVFIATVAALGAGYMYDPREINNLLIRWWREQITIAKLWAGCKESIQVTIPGLLFYSLFGVLIFGRGLKPGTDPSTPLNDIGYMVTVILVTFVFSIVGGAVGLFPFLLQSELFTGEDLSWVMPIHNWIKVKMRSWRWQIAKYDDLIQKVIMICAPLLVLIYWVGSAALFVIDISLTFAMIPSKKPRLAVMFGTFTGTIVAAMLHGYGYIPALAVLHGTTIGGLTGLGAYYLRHKITCLTAAEAS